LGAGDKPVVALSNPSVYKKVQVGQEIKVQSASVDTAGIVRVELVIDSQVVWVDANANPEPETPFIVAQPWTPKTPGTHTIQARAYNPSNIAGESEPLTIEVVADTSLTAEPAPLAEPTPTLGTTPVDTATSTATAAVSPTRTPESARGESLPTPTATKTPTATPKPQTFAPTGLEPEGQFRNIWLELGGEEGRLGYPTSPEISDRDYAKQVFEKGLMIWWDRPDYPDYIWVIDSPTADFRSGATANLYPNTWPGGDEYSCNEARNRGPVRGFGQVWCEHPELQTRLGYPSEPEAGSAGRPPYAHVQFFQGGTMIYNPLNNEVYVLFAQGDWQRFDHEE
jgi:hypothetical protein